MNQAIYELYPNVVRTVGEIAYDAQDNIVEYDAQAVAAKAEADAQAAEAAKQSALSKLAALGLTDAEIKALTGN